MTNAPHDRQARDDQRPVTMRVRASLPFATALAADRLHRRPRLQARRRSSMPDWTGSARTSASRTSPAHAAERRDHQPPRVERRATGGRRFNDPRRSTRSIERGAIDVQPRPAAAGRTSAVAESQRRRRLIAAVDSPPATAASVRRRAATAAAASLPPHRRRGRRDDRGAQRDDLYRGRPRRGVGDRRLRRHPPRRRSGRRGHQRRPSKTAATCWSRSRPRSR